MDADFSHDPADVPRLIAATEGDAGADLALGSRYVAGGGVGDWGRGRQAISRWGSIYARTWLGLADPGPHRRLQVLPARGPGGDPAGDGQRARLRVPDRDDLPCRPGRFQRRRDPDRVPRPPGRGVEDEPRDRRRSRMESAVDAISRQPLALRPFQYFIFCSKVSGAAGPPVRLIRSIYKLRPRTTNRGAPRDGEPPASHRQQLPGRGARRERARPRRLLGPVVRPLPGRPPDPRGDVRRARRPQDRLPQHRREPGDRRASTRSCRSRR